MAGDWIKMRKELADDPAVVAVAASTGLDDFGVVGRLHKLWSWADTHTIDGNASCVTGVTAIAWLDRYLSRDGFAAALIAVGWLVVDEAGIHLPGYTLHNGDTAKKRALGSKRTAKTRQTSHCHTTGNARSVTSVTQEALQGDASSVTQGALPEKRREEKRREELDETGRDDQIDSCFSLDWTPEFCEATRAAANRMFRGRLNPRTAEDRDFLLKVAALLVVGEVPEHVVADAVAGVQRRDPPPDKPVAFFWSVLAENLGQAGQRLQRLLARVSVPESIGGRPRPREPATV